MHGWGQVLKVNRETESHAKRSSRVVVDLVGCGVEGLDVLGSEVIGVGLGACGRAMGRCSKQHTVSALQHNSWLGLRLCGTCRRGAWQARGQDGCAADLAARPLSSR